MWKRHNNNNNNLWRKYTFLRRPGVVSVAGFSDNGEMWRHEFETETFVEDMENLWKEVEPLYLELHTYVKNKLRNVYGDKIGDDDLIPAHILGSWYMSIMPRKRSLFHLFTQHFPSGSVNLGTIPSTLMSAKRLSTVLLKTFTVIW